MIVPRNQLLIWTALIAPPFALLGATGSAGAALAVVAVGALGVAAIADAVRTRHRLDGVSVVLPPIARMSKDRDAKIDLQVRNAHPGSRRLRIGLAWPADIGSPHETMEVMLPENAAAAHFSWPCRPRQRGSYPLNAVYLEVDSPLGFWSLRRTLPARGEIRVYPNLIEERRKLSALFLNRGAYGTHAQRHVGKGHEFEKLREYVAGDGYDDIHWKTTAKRGRPVTKVFQVERTQEVYVAIDISRLSARPVPRGEDAPPAPALEQYLTAALALGLAAEQQGDLFGLLVFGDKVGKFVRARNGAAHYNACRDSLYTLQPQLVSPDFDEVCTFIRLRMRRRTLLVFITALDNPELAAGFVKNVDLIRRQHLVLVNMLQPPGVAPLFSSDDVAAADDLYQRLGGHLAWQELRELEKVLQRRGVHFSLLKNERFSADLVSQYLRVKQRQLL
ncbi:MAG TPA: DUF58 domain-containing protein [Opitutales bacterium]|nr:DUF58 domain-containing protein [Opitutales bacterium]